MATRITTYDRLEVLFTSKMDVLLAKMETNKQISIYKFRELKEDLEELKQHAKETNGYIKEHSNSIVVLEEKQCQESKRRKRIWAVLLTSITAAIGLVIRHIISNN